MPVQFSVDFDSGEHHEWIAEDSSDPREQLARALVRAVRGAKTIAAYNSPFEYRCVVHLRDNLPRLAHELDGVLARLVDVLPIVVDHVYHPDFGGSFSLKKVVPALLEGDDFYGGLAVTDGGTASVELERLLFDDGMTEGERREVRTRLLAYCAVDTRALSRLVARLRTLIT